MMFHLYRVARGQVSLVKCLVSRGAHCTMFEGAKEVPACLEWLNAPASSSCTKDGLEVTCKSDTDFWQVTHYLPAKRKTDGHMLLHREPLPLHKQWSVEACFTLKPIHQFDQAGIMVYGDEGHWLKTGIEYVDGEPMMSCVVTENRSDWSTRPWTNMNRVSVRLTVDKTTAMTVECEVEEKKKRWEFMRLTSIAFPTPPRVGIYACAPVDCGMSVVFHKLTINNA